MGVSVARVPEPKGDIGLIGVGHVVYRTADPSRMIDWYCELLGAQVVLRHEAISFITWDHAQDRMAFMTIPEPVPEDTPRRVDHVALEIEDLTRLVALYRRMQSKGITPYQAFNHGVSTSMYFHDPDGNQVEITVENFDSVDELNEWLSTGEFNVNPLGVAVEPEALAERIETSGAKRFAPEPNHRTWLAEHGRP